MLQQEQPKATQQEDPQELKQDEKISVTTQDGVNRQISKSLYNYHSSVFRDLQSDHDPDTPIPLMIDDNIFGKLDAFLQGNGEKPFKAIDKPPKSQKYSEIVTREEFEFVTKLTMEDLYPMSRAGKYLNINHISDMTLYFIASMFIGKTVNEIRDQFGIEQQSQEFDDKVRLEFEKSLEESKGQTE